MRAVPRTARDVGRLVVLVLPVPALLVALVVGGALPARAADGGSTSTGGAVSISLIPATSSALRPAPAAGGPAVKTTDSVRISLIPATSSAIVPTAKSAGHAQPARATRAGHSTEPVRKTEAAQPTAAHITRPAEPAQSVAVAGSVAGAEGVQRPAPASLGNRSASQADRAADPADPKTSQAVSISLIPATSSAIATPAPDGGGGSAIRSSESAAGGAVPDAGSPSTTAAQDLRVSLAMAEAVAGQAPDEAPVLPSGAADGGSSSAWLLIGAAVLVVAGAMGIVLARLRGWRRTPARPRAH
jgi:hypothetical protein